METEAHKVSNGWNALILHDLGLFDSIISIPFLISNLYSLGLFFFLSRASAFILYLDPQK